MNDKVAYEWVEATVEKGNGSLGLEMESRQLDQTTQVAHAPTKGHITSEIVVSGFVNRQNGRKGAAESCGMLLKGDILVAIDGVPVEGCDIEEIANRYGCNPMHIRYCLLHLSTHPPWFPHSHTCCKQDQSIQCNSSAKN